MCFHGSSPEHLHTYQRPDLVLVNVERWSPRDIMELQSGWKNKYIISFYDVLKTSILDHLRVIQATITVKLRDDYVMLYNLNKMDDKEHFHSLQDMSVRVFVHSERLLDSDLKLACHTNG